MVVCFSTWACDKLHPRARWNLKTAGIGSSRPPGGGGASRENGVVNGWMLSFMGEAASDSLSLLSAALFNNKPLMTVSPNSLKHLFDLSVQFHFYRKIILLFTERTHLLGAIILCNFSFKAFYVNFSPLFPLWSEPSHYQPVPEQNPPPPHVFAKPHGETATAQRIGSSRWQRWGLSVRVLINLQRKVCSWGGGGGEGKGGEGRAVIRWMMYALFTLLNGPMRCNGIG